MAYTKTGGYVKFVRGTEAAFNALLVKNPDTLYFITDDNNSNLGSLYLGSQLIGGQATSLNDLLKVNIDEIVGDSVLVYDANIKDWVPTKLEDLIANIDHLKRKIFTSEEEILAFIAENEDTAGSYIYMLPSGLEFDSNKYYEYIYIDGTLEQVGNWEVDLDDYLTEDEVTKLLQDYYTEEEIDGFLADYALKTDLNSYYTSEQINNLLLNYYSATQIDTLLNGYVQKEEGKSLVSDTEINKLKTVKENAEPNYIKSVTSNFKVSEAGQLSLETISIGKVEDLQDALDAKVNSIFTTNEDGSKTPWTLLSPENQEKLAALTIGNNGDLSISGKVNAENVEGLASWITTNRNTVDGLFSSVEAGKLKEIETGAQVNFINSVNEDIFTVDENKTLDLKNAYVLQSVFDNKVGNLDELILSEEKTNLVEQVNYLSERMTWYEITQS